MFFPVGFLAIGRTVICLVTACTFVAFLVGFLAEKTIGLGRGFVFRMHLFAEVFFYYLLIKNGIIRKEKIIIIKFFFFFNLLKKKKLYLKIKKTTINMSKKNAKKGTIKNHTFSLIKRKQKK